MGFFNNLFKKKDIDVESEEDIHKKRRELMGEITKGMNEVSYKDAQELARQQPNNPFFQDIKNKDEFLIRNKISSLAALMAGDDIDWLEACKEIIEYADKGLKINPDSAYLLYFRGRSKGDLKKD